MEAPFQSQIINIAASYSDEINGLIKTHAIWYRQSDTALERKFGEILQKTLDIAETIHSKEYDQIEFEEIEKFQKTLIIARDTTTVLMESFKAENDKRISKQFLSKINNCTHAIEAIIKSQPLKQVDEINEDEISSSQSRASVKQDIDHGGEENNDTKIKTQSSSFANKNKINKQDDEPASDNIRITKKVAETLKKQLNGLIQKYDSWYSISDNEQEDMFGNSIGNLQKFIDTVLSFKDDHHPTYNSRLLLAITGATTSAFGLMYDKQEDNEIKEKFEKLLLWGSDLIKKIIDGHKDLNIEYPDSLHDDKFDKDVKSPSSAGSYWLIKLNDHNWEIDKLKPNDEFEFHSHTRKKQKRVDYDLFGKVQKGDIVLGYAYGNRNAIVCGFEITDTLHQNPSREEVIGLRIAELINPHILFSSISEKLNFANDLGTTSLKKLFPLPLEVYNEIITMAGQIIPGVTSSNFLPFLEREGNHSETKDQLDFENDIGSLASVIAMKDVKPPLAIGLFGKWGSGKSFFMKQLKKKIIELKGYDKDTYVQNVVHVEFNSWHYSDTNLWASMVTKIFDALDQYSKGTQDDEEEDPIEKMKRATEKIRVLNGQKAAIENEKQKLEKEIREKEDTQKKKREELADLTGFKILKLVISNKHVRESYSELKNPDIENILNDKEKINQYTKELEKSKNDLFAIFKIIGSFRGRKWLWAISIVIIIFLVKWLATTIFKEQYESITKFFSYQSATLLAIIVNIIKYTADARKNITEAHDKMFSLKKTFDRPEDDKEVNDLKENKNQLESELKDIEIELTKTKKDMEDVESGRMLLDFVEKRSKDTNYASQLGLISWIRKDFENLTRLLSGQDAALSAARNGKPGEKEPEVVLKVDRIILYIDDLDRCNEDLVVKVLEAIHLILAFELFVVVVGVDPRWLNNALNEKYKMLFGVPEKNGQQHLHGLQKKNRKSLNGKTNENSENKINEGPEIKINESILDAATSYDYLEKIFQIPFCLKPINKKGRENLIGYLLDRGNKKEEEANPDPTENHSQEDSTSHMADDHKEKEREVTQDHDPQKSQVEEKETETLATDDTIDKADKKPKAQKKVDPPIRVNFTEEEKKFMKDMSILFGQSPRSINRYVNIYRIIKAHKGFYKSGKYPFEKYAPTLFLLGVVVGHSVYASDFIDAINKAKDGAKFETFIKRRTLNKELVKEIVKCSDDKLWKMKMVDYKRDLNLISRFSFRTLIDEEK